MKSCARCSSVSSLWATVRYSAHKRRVSYTNINCFPSAQESFPSSSLNRSISKACDIYDIFINNMYTYLNALRQSYEKIDTGKTHHNNLPLARINNHLSNSSMLAWCSLLRTDGGNKMNNTQYFNVVHHRFTN